MAEEDRRTSSRSIRRTHWIFLSISHSKCTAKPDKDLSNAAPLNVSYMPQILFLIYLLRLLTEFQLYVAWMASCRCLEASLFSGNSSFSVPYIHVVLLSFPPLPSTLLSAVFFYLETDKHLSRSRSNRSSKCNSSDIGTKSAKSVFHTDLIENCTHHHATNPCS